MKGLSGYMGWLICIVGGLSYLYSWWVDSSVLLVGWLICIVGGLTHLYCWWVDSFVLLVGWLICIVGGIQPTNNTNESTHQLYRWVNPPTIQMSQPTNYTDESTHQQYRWVNPLTIQMSQPTNNTDELVGWLICIVSGLTHLYSWWVDSSV
jgi:hypothetical protein